MIVGPQYRAPRLPVALCHGLFGFDVLGPHSFPPLQIHYWKGVSKALTKLGVQLYIPRVSPVGSIEHRASQLHAYLMKHLPARRLNLVAHSMGGLDGRYLLSVIQPWEYTIVSLTTIATPHHGSAFMDWCKENLGVGHLNDPIKPSGWKIMMGKLDVPAFSNLTTDYCRNTFNPRTPNVDGILYASYAAVSDFKHLSPLYYPHQIIQEREGPNDGLVSLCSAQWGHFLGTVECDHMELIPSPIQQLSGYTRRQTFDPVEFYLSLVTQLYDYGF